MAEAEFYCTINEEGPSKTHRAKLPSGVINSLGGKKGELVHFIVDTKTKKIIGGGIVRGRNADRIISTTLRTQSKPTGTRKPKSEGNGKVVKKSSAQKKVAKTVPAKKPASRKVSAPVKKVTSAQKKVATSVKKVSAPVKKVAKPARKVKATPARKVGKVKRV